MAYSVSKAAGKLAYGGKTEYDVLSGARPSPNEVSCSNARPEGSS